MISTLDIECQGEAGALHRAARRVHNFREEINMRRALALGLCVCGLAVAADPPYAGKWKMNLAKSNFGESTITYEPAGGGAMKMTMDGQSYTFTPDGKEVKTPWGTTMSIKSIDAKTWSATETTNGKVSMAGTMKVSDDDKTLSMNAKRTKPDGGTSDESMTLTRVSGGHGLAGKWKMKNMNSSAPESLEITPQGADGVRIAIGGDGGVCNPKLDGKEYPAKGKMWPAGWSCAVTKAGDGLDVRWRRDGKDMYKINWSASADGKTLTEKGSAAGVNETFTIVYDRQ
jgi:hypothetical protein